MVGSRRARQQAVLEQQRKEAEAAKKPFEAFALKCQRDELEEYANKMQKRANSRYFAGKSTHVP